MSDLYWLMDEQMARLAPFLRELWSTEGYDRHVLSGIIFVRRNGFRWGDAPYLKAHCTASSLRAYCGSSAA